MKHCAALIREYGPAQLHLPSTHLPHTHARSILKKRKKQILEYICTGVDIHRVDFTSPQACPVRIQNEQILFKKQH